jgi:hypothetical protein
MALFATLVLNMYMYYCDRKTPLRDALKEIEQNYSQEEVQ